MTAENKDDTSWHALVLYALDDSDLVRVAGLTIAFAKIDTLLDKKLIECGEPTSDTIGARLSFPMRVRALMQRGSLTDHHTFSPEDEERLVQAARLRHHVVHSSADIEGRLFFPLRPTKQKCYDAVRMFAAAADRLGAPNAILSINLTVPWEQRTEDRFTTASFNDLLGAAQSGRDPLQLAAAIIAFGVAEGELLKLWPELGQSALPSALKFKEAVSRAGLPDDLLKDVENAIRSRNTCAHEGRAVSDEAVIACVRSFSGIAQALSEVLTKEERRREELRRRLEDLERESPPPPPPIPPPPPPPRFVGFYQLASSLLDAAHRMVLAYRGLRRPARSAYETFEGFARSFANVVWKVLTTLLLLIAFSCLAAIVWHLVRWSTSPVHRSADAIQAPRPVREHTLPRLTSPRVRRH